MKKLLEIVDFFRIRSKKDYCLNEEKKRSRNHIPNWLQEISETLTYINARNLNLQTTPFRIYDSGLPKEAYVNISNFRANRKRAVLGNLPRILPIF